MKIGKKRIERNFSKIVIVSMCFTLMVLLLFRFLNTSLVPKEIKNTYYFLINENEKTEYFIFNDDIFRYKYLENDKFVEGYKNCQEYSYNKIKKTISLKCPMGFKKPRDFIIKDVGNEKLILQSGNKEYNYFKTKEMAVKDTILKREGITSYFYDNIENMNLKEITNEQISNIKNSNSEELLIVLNKKDPNYKKVILDALKSDYKVNYISHDKINIKDINNYNNKISLYLIKDKTYIEVQYKCDLIQCNLKDAIDRKGV